MFTSDQTCTCQKEAWATIDRLALAEQLSAAAREMQDPFWDNLFPAAGQLCKRLSETLTQGAEEIRTLDNRGVKSPVGNLTELLDLLVLAQGLAAHRANFLISVTGHFREAPMPEKFSLDQRKVAHGLEAAELKLEGDFLSGCTEFLRANGRLLYQLRNPCSADIFGSGNIIMVEGNLPQELATILRAAGNGTPRRNTPAGAPA